MTQPWDSKLWGLEIRSVRPKAHCRPSVETAYLTYHLQCRDLVAVSKRHVVFLTTTSDPDLQTRRERVDYRHTDTMQSTREAIVFQRKFAAGMQTRQDHFYTRHLLLGMEVHGHPTPIVFHGQRAILIERHLDCSGMTHDSLIHAIVNHLLGQMIGARRVRKHAWALAHWLQAAQDFNGRGVVDVTHRCDSLMRDGSSAFVFDSMGSPPL